MISLRGLNIFARAAQLGSFKKVADELHLTPGAVGQQIQNLEQWLGVKLFYRHPRHVELSDFGKDYYHRIAAALNQIEQASRHYRELRHNQVCLSLTPSLASKWFGVRMADFMTKYPGFDVQINASTDLVNFSQSSVDLAIRYCKGVDPKLSHDLLHHSEIRMLCSPQYQAKMNLKRPDDLYKATLLHTKSHASWRDWFDQYTAISLDQQKQFNGVYFDQTLPAIEAAKHHQGVVLCSNLLVENELKNRELIEPFKKRLEYAEAYYLVHPKNIQLSKPALALKQWILSEFKQTHSNAEH